MQKEFSFKISFFVLAFLLSSVLPAQDSLRFKTSQYFDVSQPFLSDHEKRPAIFGKDDQYIYTGATQANGKKLILSAFDKNDLNKVWDKVISTPDYLGKKTSSRGVCVTNDRLWLFTKRDDFGGSDLVAFPISSTGEVSEEGILVASNGATSFNMLNGKSEENILSFSYLKELDRILIFSTYDADKKAKKKLEFTVLSKDLTDPVTVILPMDYPSEYIDIKGWRTNDEGKMFIYGVYSEFDHFAVDKGKKAAKKFLAEGKISTFKPFVIGFDAGTSETRLFSLHLPQGIRVTDLRYNIIPGGLAIGGVYSTNPKKNIAAGMYMQKIIWAGADASNEKIEVSVPFASDSGNVNDESWRMLNRWGYSAKYFLPGENGEMFIVGEEIQKIDIPADNNYNSKRMNHYTYFYDVFVMKLNKKGEIQWVKMIDRYQETLNEESIYGSFTPVMKDSTLFIVFNDHPKNYGEGKMRRMRSFNALTPVASTIIFSSSGNAFNENRIVTAVTEIDLASGATVRYCDNFLKGENVAIAPAYIYTEKQNPYHKVYMIGSNLNESIIIEIE